LDRARTFKFTLRDATFQDGTPITAEHVKFSFDFLDNNHEDLKGGVGIGHSSIEVQDEKTLTVSFDEPSLPFINRTVPLVGIINKEVWAEADGNAGSFEPPEGTASGPFAITEFQSGERMEMETHTGHPFAPDTDELSGITVVAFDEEASLVNAMRAGEVHTANDISFNGYSQLSEEDNMFVDVGLDYLPHTMVPYYPTAPTKFSEFRKALGMAINRQEMQAVGLPGLDIEPELHSRVLVKRHPWAAPEDMLTKFTEDPTGDGEGAKQVLADAGWGWDDQGNLHYPADADLSPRWPDGEAPSTDDFPCLEEILNA
jgi:peptide/nickel transport system substrate-binding protein